MKAVFRVLSRFYAERDQFSECFVISSDNIQEDQRYEVGSHIHISNTKASDLDDSINLACLRLPEDFIFNIVIERGSAWIECYNPLGEFLKLPDSTDKSLAEHLKECIDHICPE